LVSKAYKDKIPKADTQIDPKAEKKRDRKAEKDPKAEKEKDKKKTWFITKEFLFRNRPAFLDKSDVRPAVRKEREESREDIYFDLEKEVTEEDIQKLNLRAVDDLMAMVDERDRRYGSFHFQFRFHSLFKDEKDLPFIAQQIEFDLKTLSIVKQSR
jgi:hypothetical protein